VDSLSDCHPEFGAVIRYCLAAATRRGLCGASRPAFILMTMLTLTTGSAFIMWLGEQIPNVALAMACRC